MCTHPLCMINIAQYKGYKLFHWYQITELHNEFLSSRLPRKWSSLSNHAVHCNLGISCSSIQQDLSNIPSGSSNLNCRYFRLFISSSRVAMYICRQSGNHIWQNLLPWQPVVYSTEMLLQVTTVLGVGPLECLPLPWLHHTDTTECCMVTAPSQRL